MYCKEMVVSRIVLLFVLSIPSISIFGQVLSEKITLDFTEEPLLEVLHQLDQKTSLQLSYNPQILPSGKLVTKSFQEESLEYIVKEILGTSYQLKNIGNYLIIQKAPTSKKEKKSFQMKGGIRDATTGEELKDVSIYEVNSLRSTLSDEEGVFSLKTESEFEEATFVLSKRFYQDTVIRVKTMLELSAPITLKQEAETIKKRQMIREKVNTFSNGLSEFFTPKQTKKNAENVNFVDTRFIQASLIPSLGTNLKMSSQIKNKISVNLLAGYGYGVDGLEIGGFYNIDRAEVRGVQLGGFGNAVGGEVHGFQAGGFINTSKDYVIGVQMAGFFNLASDSVKGFQTAGFTNITRNMSGFQMAGFNNHTKEMVGAQFSGFINTTKKLDGFQLAGFINIAEDVEGLQFSVINIADSIVSGMPIGVFNFVKKNGFISPAIESDDVVPYRVSFRSGIDKFYTTLSVGIRPDEYWTYGMGFGSRLFLTQKHKLYFNPELRWFNLAKGKQNENENSYIARANFNLGYQLFKRLSITSGPSLNLYITNHLDEFNEPVFNVAGNPISDELSGNTRLQFWIGYSVGIGF